MISCCRMTCNYSCAPCDNTFRPQSAIHTTSVVYFLVRQMKMWHTLPSLQRIINGRLFSRWRIHHRIVHLQTQDLKLKLTKLFWNWKKFVFTKQVCMKWKDKKKNQSKLKNFFIIWLQYCFFFQLPRSILQKLAEILFNCRHTTNPDCWACHVNTRKYMTIY